MEKLIKICLVFMVLCTEMACTKVFQPIKKLNDLADSKKFCELYTELSANRNTYNDKALIYYDLIMKSVLNQPEKSNALIQKFREQFSKFSDTVNYNLVQIEYYNNLKLLNYKKLKELSKNLIENYKRFINSGDFVELKDDNVAYGFLENELATTVIKNTDAKIKVIKDLAGYNLLRVKSKNDSIVDMIFDTGANVNVVSESTAKKLDLRILPKAVVYVMGATGTRNASKIAIADRGFIENIEFKNAEFIVFPDSLLTFANGKYKINGVIGFPIIMRLESIRFTDSLIYIEKNTIAKTNIPNLFIKGDDYIIDVAYKNKKLPFFFDTGNSNTSFYKNMYDMDSMNFKSLKDTVFSYSSVGGTLTEKAKLMPEIKLDCGSKSFVLKNTYIALEKNILNPDLYGSIGKDFVNQYKSITMCFKYAYIDFE
ncbi:MAG: retropepsin-like aspartic protease [Bacteroidales bacterium]